MNARARISVRGSVSKAIESQVSSSAFGCGPADIVAGQDRSKGKRSAFALLPRQLFPKGEIQGGAEDWIWPKISIRRNKRAYSYFRILLVESSKRIRLA